MSDQKQKIIIPPCPELFLLDPITGELPKNYKKILEAKHSKPKEENCQSTVKASANELKFNNLPQLIKSLNDDYLRSAENANTYSNSVLNINARSAQKTVLGNVKRPRNPIGNLPLKSPGRKSSLAANKRSLRKALFADKTNNTNAHFSRRPSKIPAKPKPFTFDESLPLLDISEAENKLLVPKKKPLITKPIPKPKELPIKKNKCLENKFISSMKVEADSSSPSLKDFLQFEQQCKTPAKKNDNSLSVSLKLERIVTKLEENERLYAEYKNKIDKNITDIKSDLSVVMRKLNIDNLSDIAGKSSLNVGEDTENIPPARPLGEIGNQNSTDANTLEKKHKKKVLFDLTDNQSNANLRSSTKRNCLMPKATATPNTIVRSLSRIAEEQYLTLQDTPRIRH